MELLAEAGATKTEWIELYTCNRFISTGMNPNNMNVPKLKKEFEHLFPIDQQKQVKRINFYGSGCGIERNKRRVKDMLTSYFPNAHIEIKSDMEATSIALWGKREGISAILGTGANLWHWNGTNVTEKIPSLGYIFGEEGSGAYFGKKLLHDIFLKKLPDTVLDDFYSSYNLPINKVIEQVYHNHGASSFLASFAPFIEKHISELQIKEMVDQGFDSFFANYLPFISFKSDSIGFCGSIAYHFSSHLKDVAKKYNFQNVRIIKAAMPKLIEYHKS